MASGGKKASNTRRQHRTHYDHLQPPELQMMSRAHFQTIVAAARITLDTWERERRHYLRQISLDPHCRTLALPYAQRRLQAVNRKIERLQQALPPKPARGGSPSPSSRA
jgi:hypothetical protein